MEHPTESDQHESEGGFYTLVGSRRSFFQWVTGGIPGVIGLGLAVPLAGYFISPALIRRKVVGISWKG